MRTFNSLLLEAVFLANAVQTSAANARKLSSDISVAPFAVLNSSTVTLTPPSPTTPTQSTLTPELIPDVQLSLLSSLSSSAPSSVPYPSASPSSRLSSGTTSSILSSHTTNTHKTSTSSTWLSSTTSFPSTSGKNSTTASSHSTKSSTAVKSSTAINSSSTRPQTTLRTTTHSQSGTSSNASSTRTRHGTRTKCHGTTCSHHGHHPITTTVDVQKPNATEKCTLLGEGETATVYDIIYTATVTFKGNRTDYRPPHPTITTPHYCAGTAAPAFPHGIHSSISHASSDSVIVVYSSGGEEKTTTVPYSKLGSTRILQKPITTYTFITTDKNPSVYYPSEHIPNYSQTWNVPGGGNPPVTHKTVDPVGGGNGPDGVDGPLPTFTITAGRGTVVINKSTFTGLSEFQTSTVTVGSATFTINPTGIVGEGATMTRPGQTPVVTRAVGGVPVTIAGTKAIIGGQTLTLPPVPTTTNINGHVITLGPAGITINGRTITPEIPQPTQWNVQGGEILTAIGKSVVVVHSTTVTYGPGTPEKITVINGDTVSIEPTGVVVHGSTLGGPDAEATDTKKEIIGGATIGKIPPSMVVINGRTYSIGPGAGLRTVVAGNEVITLGPLGVIMASITMSFPLDATMVTTFAGTRTPAADLPAETGGNNDDEDSGSLALRPDMRTAVMIFCIAIGVLIIG